MAIKPRLRNNSNSTSKEPLRLRVPDDVPTIYLDHAATTPVDRRVRATMEPFCAKNFGNPSALYRQGRDAKAALKNARERVAKILDVQPAEITFTGSGTESDNLAVLGVARAARENSDRNHIITTAIEHRAVLNACKVLERENFKITYLPVDRTGLVRPKDLKKAIRPTTALISIIYANNEIGTIQPLKELTALAHSKDIPFHTDACQAAGFLDVRPDKLGVNLLTLNASKMYGPKGVGVLYHREDIPVQPLIVGGSQEQGLRAGTENLMGIVGFAKALEIAEVERGAETQRLTKLRDYFLAGIRRVIPEAKINGHLKERLPNNVHISIAGIEGDSAVKFLDEFGVACATGSACEANAYEPSYVVLALGRSYRLAQGSLRFTLGRTTAKSDINYVLKHLPPIVKVLIELPTV